MFTGSPTHKTSAILMLSFSSPYGASVSSFVKWRNLIAKFPSSSNIPYGIYDLSLLNREMCVCVCVCVCVCAHALTRVWLFVTPRTVAAWLLCPWKFPGKNIGASCHFMLQRIFPSEGSSPHLLYILHWQVDSLPLGHWGNPKTSKGVHQWGTSF